MFDTEVTVPYTALLGADELPDELASYGPSPAALARDLAAGGTCQRILTDPTSGRPLDYGTTHYRPPTHLAEPVITGIEPASSSAAACRRIAARPTTALPTGANPHPFEVTPRAMPQWFTLCLGLVPPTRAAPRRPA